MVYRDEDRDSPITERIRVTARRWLDALSTCPACGHDTDADGCNCPREDCACGKET